MNRSAQTYQTGQFWTFLNMCGEPHREMNPQRGSLNRTCDLQIDRDVAGARNNFFAAYGMAVGVGYDGFSSA